MKTIRYQRSNSTVISTTSVDLGLTDEKGRRIGYVIVRRTVTLTAVPESTECHGWAYTMDSDKFVEGAWHEGYVQTTRNGEQYGASQNVMLVHSMEDLDRRIETKAADMVKRYSKKYGRN